MVRAGCFDSNGMKKGAWSEEEDNKLRAFVFTYGHFNWRLLPKYAGLARCGKSCRLRWVNYLKPGVKRGNFTKQEQHLIIQLHAQFGNKWSVIATYLPGRTDNDIKNFWNGHIEKRRKRNPDSKKLVKWEAKEESLSSASSLIKLEETAPEVDLRPDHHMLKFLGDGGYDHKKDHCLPPLIEEAGFFYDDHHYRELSISLQSSYMSGFEWDHDRDSEYVAEGSLLALDTSNGSFYDPFFDQHCFSYGTLN